MQRDASQQVVIDNLQQRVQQLESETQRLASQAPREVLEPSRLTPKQQLTSLIKGQLPREFWEDLYDFCTGKISSQFVTWMLGLLIVTVMSSFYGTERTRQMLDLWRSIPLTQKDR
jgi:hypothetical protein